MSGARDLTEAGRQRHASAQRRYRARQRLREASDPVAAAAGRARRESYWRTWHARHPEKVRAQRIVRNELRRGRLVRADACEHCRRVGPTEASHFDYAEPKVVEWLCRQCHARKDRKLPTPEAVPA